MDLHKATQEILSRFNSATGTDEISRLSKSISHNMKINMFKLCLQVAAVEGINQITKGQLVSLSEPQLVDCDTTNHWGFHGCGIRLRS